MSKAERERQIARARERADLARLRFGNAIDGVLDRLTPDRLRAEAIEIVADQFEQTRHDLIERFRRWPIAVAAAGVAMAVFTFWSPARVLVRYAMRLASIVWTTRDLWRRFK